MGGFPTTTMKADLCVVGGGMAGLCAAVAAARHGAKVALMHERPVLGGNASSECRVHIGGADVHNSRKNMRETGILEEIRLENLARNPNRSYSIWDLILFETVRREPNIELLLNCACVDAAMDGGRIASVAGWQLTTQTWRKVEAKIFADCSGDGALAPLTGADFRMGREARSEYGEPIAPETADARTMGMTCLFQARQFERPQPFDPPAWAETYERCEDLPNGARGHRWWTMGYWWVELGGEADSIRDTEQVRDELLRIVFGVWDHIKNRCPHTAEAKNWALDWIQFLPGKRESRRYAGAHVLTQGDVEAGGLFEDIVAYGGWSMDDHHPAGFRAVKLGAPPTIFHPAPSPYGIPYRCLYSRNVPNLMFAGRVASATHAAMSSARVMGTCCSMGQALGTAAAMAVGRGIEPAGVLAHIPELQQRLIADDAYVPGILQQIPAATAEAELTASRGDPEPVRDGINRPVGDAVHAWTGGPGDWLVYRFTPPLRDPVVSLVLDSALDRNIVMSDHQKDDQLSAPPDVMPKAFRLETRTPGGSWQEQACATDNIQRHVRFALSGEVEALRFTLDATWGAPQSRVYAFWAYAPPE